jgi:hypothetical protein
MCLLFYRWLKQIFIAFIILFSISSCQKKDKEINDIAENQIENLDEEISEIDTVKSLRNDTLSVRGIYGIIMDEGQIEDLILVRGDSIKVAELLNKLNSKLGKDNDKENDFEIRYFYYSDLDSDGAKEVVLFYSGYYGIHGTLAIFKQINNRWENLFAEEFSHQYSGVSLSVEACGDENKLVRINNLEQRGSGIHKTGIYFFRLVENKFKVVLRVLKRGQVLGWGLPLNQKIESESKVDSIKNEIVVRYNYDFHPGPILQGDLSWEGHPELSFVSGEMISSYQWDEIEQNYILKDREQERKIMMFDDFGNDSLFVDIYRTDLEKIVNSKDSIIADATGNYLMIFDGLRPLILEK